jgi:hypothetical protein
MAATGRLPFLHIWQFFLPALGPLQFSTSKGVTESPTWRPDEVPASHAMPLMSSTAASEAPMKFPALFTEITSSLQEFDRDACVDLIVRLPI